MQKRSHKLLAAALLKSQNGFRARRYELAFLFGSFQPDCNPFTYLKGILRSHKPQGHNYSSSQHYISSRIRHLQQRRRWTIWQYYTLGKLTHYLADAFTYPHNAHFPDTLFDHHHYETSLRLYLADYLSRRSLHRQALYGDLFDSLDCLHRQYMSSESNVGQDALYILQATSLLMAGCHPAV